MFKYFQSEESAFEAGALEVYQERIVGKTTTMLTFGIFRKEAGKKRFRDTGDRRVAGRGRWIVTDTSFLPPQNLPESLYREFACYDRLDPKDVFIGRLSACNG